MTRTPRLLLIGLVLGLAACAGTGTSSALYVLDTNTPDGPANTTENRRAERTLVVESVSLSPILDETGIVYQTGPHRIVVANNNRWASPLAAQLTDGLYGALAGALDRVSVQRAERRAPPNALRLVTRVDEFYGHYDGTAHIAGRWELHAADGTRLAGRRFERRIPLVEDGYDALVTSLSQGWRAVAKRIAPQVSQALPASRGGA